MSKIPLSHFRVAMAHLATTDAAVAHFFAGTQITREQINSPDFDLSAKDLWLVCDNVLQTLGPGWYFNIPDLWSAGTQGDLENAMRAAPNLREAHEALVKYGSVRMPTMRWSMVYGQTHMEGQTEALVPIPPAHWQMINIFSVLNSQSIFGPAYPGCLAEITHQFTGPPPVAADIIDQHFRMRVSWNAASNITRIPNHLLDIPSALGDAKAFASLCGAMEGQLPDAPNRWGERVSRLLDEAQGYRMTSQQAATVLGLSLRSLERNLAEEGACFRALQDEAMKRKLQRLFCTDNLTLAEVAEKLGYSDDTALSRSVKRWYGCTAAEARRRSRQSSAALSAG